MLITTEVIKMTEATAYSGGNITSDVGSDVTSRGVCWSELPNPTIDDNKTIDAAGTGVFESRIVGLNPSTTYYVRAYATNKSGTSYGIQVTFKTKSLTITTQPVTNIVNNSALFGGIIISDGDSLDQIDCGFCWSVNPNPTIEMNKRISNHKGIGEFKTVISELQSTLYYVRAYYTNTHSIYYGNVVSFSTIDNAVKTDGTLTVKATTSTYSGEYAPHNVVAIWIESGSGSFVKTLLTKAGVRKQYLTNWMKASGGNTTTDATTGATVNSHSSYTVSWNGKNASGTTVGDGSYNVCIEFTESNGSGKFATFSFTKGISINSQTPAAKSNISNVILTWTPVSK